MNNVPLGRRKQHESLIRETREKRGKEFGDRLERFWLLRKRADYDEPEFLEASPFQGDLDKFRLSALEHLDLMEREFESYISEMGNFLEPR